MRSVNGGNFAGWLRATLFGVGLVLTAGGIGLDPMPRWIRMGAFLLGFAAMALAGISSRTHMLKIKPLDNSYKKARDSYKPNECDDEDNSK